MENLDRILEAYGNHPKLQELHSLIEVLDSPAIQIAGLTGASSCFIQMALLKSLGKPIIIVEETKESAAYTLNTLQELHQKGRPYFLPDSFKRPGIFDRFDNHNIQLKTEAISHLNIAKQGLIVVTYPEALFEYSVSPKLIEKEKIVVEKGESLDVDLVFEYLLELKFERVDFVYEPGQYSMRGGIVDIYSFGNEWPYRIELFDDEVESIREFEPMTQLSRRNLNFVSILPNVKSSFGEDSKRSFDELIPEDAIVWFANAQLCYEIIEKCETNFKKWMSDIEYELKDQEETIRLYREFRYTTAEEIMVRMQSFSRLYEKVDSKSNITHKLDFLTRPQTAFNKNLRLFAQELNSNRDNGIESFIFSENARQIERLHNIFEDIDSSVQFEPVVKGIFAGFVDSDLKIACYTDHEIFKRFHTYKLKKGFTKDQAMNLKMIRELQPGDFVTHMDHGIGRYSGLEKIDIGGNVQESVRLIYKNRDILYVSIHSLHKISKYSGKDSSPPVLSKLGGDAWKTLKRKTKKKVKDIAKELIALYAKRKSAVGHEFGPDGYLQNELEASFIYEDTPDQFTATQQVKEDMMQPYPMDRLICGDVGFGKTEIAVRATFKAVSGGKQVAILVPTTILALQHKNTFEGRLQEFGIRIDYVNRFRTAKDKKAIFADLAEGKIEVVIGTHALLNKSIKFKDLGLLIIDEEQKFGVAAKDKLKMLKVNVDTLTLTATPIPRTLQFSLMSARDLSIMRTPPPNRQPIHTERRIFGDELIRDAIYYEYYRGGQVFFVHNRVKSLADMAAMVKRICPDVDVKMAHGQMEAKTLESTLLDFIDHKFDVLVCTNIIETGLDISNANTIIINNAHHYGLSDLHQLRGRVGRSNKKAFCYLFTPPLSVLTTEARKRIQTIEDFSDLGSGFHIAMKDLDIRGAGNLLGGEQSGFVSDIGYITYQKILDEAIQELKDDEFKEFFQDEEGENKDYSRDVDLETDVEILIPDDYVSVIQQRLNLYTELDQISEEEGLNAFEKNMLDRFGPIPSSALELFDALRLRWVAKKIGFEKVSVKGGILRCFFLKNPSSSFYESDHFQRFIQNIAMSKDSGWNMKQTPKFLAVRKGGVESIGTALEALIDLLATIKA